jgi:hypothetical protein
LMRYRLSIANSLNLFEHVSEVLNHILQTEVNAQNKLNLGLMIDTAYQVMFYFFFNEKLK